MPQYYGFQRRSTSRTRQSSLTLSRHDSYELGKSEDDDTASSYDSSEEEQETLHAGCTWRLRLEQSVYDEALIIPVVRGYKGGRHSRSFIVSLLSSYVVLGVNAVLQFVITQKVGRLTQDEKQAMSEKLWGLCKERRPAEMPFKLGLDSQPENGVYLSCGPLTVTMLSKVSNVDSDGDGFWTSQEAEQEDVRWSRQYHKIATFHHVWNYFARTFAGDASWTGRRQPRAAAGQNLSAVAMPWLHRQQPGVDLCVATDYRLCGNFEARGILRDRFPSVAGSVERVEACEQHVKHTCPAMFGQVYRLYSRWTDELCGGIASSWSKLGIITVDYVLVRKYVKDLDGITSEYYFVFLVVIMLIWVMCMLDEVRLIITWWAVLLRFPSRAPNGGPDVEFAHDGGEGVSVHAIPWQQKWATLVLNLLPRTVICLLLSYIGSQFLILADDYSELILNSVALGFLIEIDNMLFAAVSREQDKELVNGCSALEVTYASCASRGLRYFPVATLYTVMILTVTCGLILQAYVKAKGKYETGAALRCLCHASGERCVAAQILGGLALVPEAAAP